MTVTPTEEQRRKAQEVWQCLLTMPAEVGAHENEYAEATIAQALAEAEARVAEDYRSGQEMRNALIAEKDARIAELEAKCQRLRQAIARIYSASKGIEKGEENPVEAAQNIQRMAHRGLDGKKHFEWSHYPYPGLLP